MEFGSVWPHRKVANCERGRARAGIADPRRARDRPASANERLEAIWRRARRQGRIVQGGRRRGARAAWRERRREIDTDGHRVGRRAPGIRDDRDRRRGYRAAYLRTGSAAWPGHRPPAPGRTARADGCRESDARSPAKHAQGRPAQHGLGGRAASPRRLDCPPAHPHERGRRRAAAAHRACEGACDRPEDPVLDEPTAPLTADLVELSSRRCARRRRAARPSSTSPTASRRSGRSRTA